ncbi:antibiotic biosynthesis monooxygenase family protein [Paenibacillus eucommiae]|uniref:Heme-degrading monooxygenase HmoA n=1 Tax=Paenibacillus eucommiae TaxID=1355755 RepID=A0ABS4IRQ6_9BACL|nr:antibiotic biosynthesis monooxygenase [Paenibacillus eucommiae]MBP1990258.1 heme-degrading monooxygenase HmoA [Paenibacillus eucommiae]
MYVYMLPSASFSSAWSALPYLKLANQEETLYIFENPTPIDVSPDDIHIYEAIDSTGTLTGGGYVVLNNIPVTEEGRAEFENRFQNRARMVEQEPGFIGIRVLRPLNGDTYVIMTIWSEESYFKKWQESQAYSHAHRKRGTSEGIDQQQPGIFPRPSFVTAYGVVLE